MGALTASKCSIKLCELVCVIATAPEPPKRNVAFGIDKVKSIAIETELETSKTLEALADDVTTIFAVVANIKYPADPSCASSSQLF